MMLYGLLYFAALRIVVYYLFEQYHYSPIEDAILVVLTAVGVVCLLVRDQRSDTHYLTSPKLRTSCVLFLILLFLLLKLDIVLYLAVIVYYIYFFIKGKCQNEYNESEKLMHCFLFAAVFFVIMAEGSGHGIADILGHLPFISEFRFLYKCSFIYVPLIIVTGAYKLDSMKKYYKPVIIASLVSVIFHSLLYSISCSQELTISSIINTLIIGIIRISNQKLKACSMKTKSIIIIDFLLLAMSVRMIQHIPTIQSNIA